MSLPGFLQMCAILIPLSLFAMATYETSPALCYSVELGVCAYFLFHPRGPYIALMRLALRFVHLLLLCLAYRILPRWLFKRLDRVFGIDLKDVSR